MTPGSFANTSQDKGTTPDKPDLTLGNSERIRHKFGSYGIGLLENSPGIRVSNLYSVHDGVKVNRTLAVVAYPEIVDQAFIKEHDAIIGGQSIGIVFKQNEWLIDKHHQYFGEIESPPGHFTVTSKNDVADLALSAIHVYSLVIKKDGSEFRYATIAEIHHPEYLQLGDLASIYGTSFEHRLEKKDMIRDFLAVIESRLAAL